MSHRVKGGHRPVPPSHLNTLVIEHCYSEHVPVRLFFTHIVAATCIFSQPCSPVGDWQYVTETVTLVDGRLAIIRSRWRPRR